MMTDPIADLLTRIRNAQRARHKSVRVPGSKIKQHVCVILQKEGYIESAEPATDSKHPAIDIDLRYIKNKPAIRHIARTSKPGRRVYVKRDEIPKVLGGLGLAILSTSKGVMTGREARSQGVGGEVLCTVY